MLYGVSFILRMETDKLMPAVYVNDNRDFQEN